MRGLKFFRERNFLVTFSI